MSSESTPNKQFTFSHHPRFFRLRLSSVSAICSDQFFVCELKPAFHGRACCLIPSVQTLCKNNGSRVALYFLLIYIYISIYSVCVCDYVCMCPFVACFNAVSRLCELETVGVDVQMHETCEEKVIFHLKIKGKIGNYVSFFFP